MEDSSATKEENPTICDNTDGPWGHYAEWNKTKKGKYHTSWT